VSAAPKALVVLVKMKQPTPAATASSSRISVPVMLVSTKAWAVWVATCGLCRVAVWMIAVAPCMQSRTKSRSQIDPT
jgi:hypothetical protein